MAKVNKAQTELLKSIVDGTKSAQGYTLIEEKHAKALVDAGHIEVNPTIKEGSKVAVRATASLIASHTTAATVASAKPTFEIMSGIAPVMGKRGGFREEIYPFSKLEIGQSFFVAATDSHPNPAETFASTVTSAVRRFAVPTGATKTNRKGDSVPEMKATRKFVIRPVTQGQKYDNGYTEATTGARIFRVA